MNERAMREYTRWAERVTDPELAEQLDAMKGDEKAIEDAFFQDLEFGTAGLRGVLGAGKLDDKGERIPVDVKVGDVVIYGKYGGNEVKIDGEEYLLMRDSDIYAVVEE